MLIEDRVAFSSALHWGFAVEHRRSVMTSAATTRATRERVPELAPTLTRDFVRVFAIAAIGANLALSVIDVWRLTFIPVMPGAIRAAVLAAMIAIPLHIRHILYGMRGERPPYGLWTLAALSLVNAVAVPLVGPAWIFQFASLAVSMLIVLPGAVGLALATAVVLSPLALQGVQWFADVPTLAGLYLVFAIAWRTTTQFVPLKLMAAIHALELAGRELESRAVVQARVRIDAELRDGVASALEQIVTRGDAAYRAANDNPALAIGELRTLVGDSRRTLTHARRVVAGYRASSVRAELDAAAALLEASGAHVQIDVADGLALDAPDPQARETIRAALARALREEPNASYRLHVSRAATGAIDVSVSANDRAVDEPLGDSAR